MTKRTLPDTAQPASDGSRKKDNAKKAVAASPTPAPIEASSLHGSGHPFKSPKDMVRLVVGKTEHQEQFLVHKGKLSKYSEFFRTACKMEWMNPENQCIELPEDDPKIIQSMVFWLYENEICVPQGLINHGLTSKTVDNDSVMNMEWGLIMKLYVLGEKYQIPELQNDATDAFISHWCEGRLEDTVEWSSRLELFKVAMRGATYIYNNTTQPDSTLRRTFVQLIMAEFHQHRQKFDYLAVLKAQVSSSVFGEICYDLASFQQENLDVDDGGGGMLFCSLRIQLPDIDFFGTMHKGVNRRLRDEAKGMTIYDDEKDT